MIERRIEWIDYARGVCAFCVLLAHNKICPHLYGQIFTPFFLVLFFFLSGYVYKERPLIESIKKLINGLVFPYLALNFVEILIGIDNWQALANSNYIYVTNKILNTVLGKNLWFVACLVMVQAYYIITSQFLKTQDLNKIKNIQLYLAIALLFNVFLIRNFDYKTAYWWADTAIFALAYFVLGNFFKQTDIFSKLENKKLLAVFALVIYLFISIVVPKHFAGVNFDFWKNYYESPLFFIFISVLGIVAILFFCINLKRPSKYFLMLGQNSLLLFAFEGKFRVITNMIFSKIKLREIVHTDYIYVLIFAFVQGIFIISFSFIVNRYVPQIVGKKKWF